MMNLKKGSKTWFQNEFVKKLSRFGTVEAIFTLGGWKPAKSSFLIGVNTSMPYFGMKTIMPSYCCNDLICWYHIKDCFPFFTQLQSVLHYIVTDLAVPRLHLPHRDLLLPICCYAELPVCDAEKTEKAPKWVCVQPPEDQS